MISRNLQTIDGIRLMVIGKVKKNGGCYYAENTLLQALIVPFGSQK
jgi:CO dehydrogenase nickel-insertion accessory protein CooC1